jgi:predicted RNase H-like HicB family nuclease
MKHYPIEIFWSAEDKGFIAEVPDLPGCNAMGSTEAEALTEAKDAIRSWLQAAKATKREIPKPTVIERIESYSGKFVVRVPRSLHARLARRAKSEGVSLNQYIAHRLSA